MSRIQHVAITLLFIIGTFFTLGAEVKGSEPIIINNKTVPVIPFTDVNSNSSTTTETPTTKSNVTTTIPTTTPTTPTPKPTTPTEKPSPPPNTTTTSTTPQTTITTPTTPSTTSVKPTNATTVAPTNATTVKPTGAPPTTPVPSHRRFDGPSFIGGIVLALGLVAIGFVAFKFYKARTELNYHTL